MKFPKPHYFERLVECYEAENEDFLFEPRDLPGTTPAEMSKKSQQLRVLCDYGYIRKVTKVQGNFYELTDRGIEVAKAWQKFAKTMKTEA